MSNLSHVFLTYFALALTVVESGTVARGTQATFKADPLRAQTKLEIQSCADCEIQPKLEGNIVVQTRVKTDSGYQTKLKAIKDIQVGDEVLAWDELQAHDNAQLAHSSQAAQTL